MARDGKAGMVLTGIAQIVNPKGEMKGSAITGPVGKEAAELWPVSKTVAICMLVSRDTNIYLPAYRLQLRCCHVSGCLLRETVHMGGVRAAFYAQASSNDIVSEDTSSQKSNDSSRPPVPHSNHNPPPHSTNLNPLWLLCNSTTIQRTSPPNNTMRYPRRTRDSSALWALGMEMCSVSRRTRICTNIA